MKLLDTPTIDPALDLDGTSETSGDGETSTSGGDPGAGSNGSEVPVV